MDELRHGEPAQDGLRIAADGIAARQGDVRPPGLAGTVDDSPDWLDDGVGELPEVDAIEVLGAVGAGHDVCGGRFVEHEREQGLDGSAGLTANRAEEGIHGLDGVEAGALDKAAAADG